MFPWKDSLHGLSSEEVRRLKRLRCKLPGGSGVVDAVGLAEPAQGAVGLSAVSFTLSDSSVQKSFLLTVHLCSVTHRTH